MTRLQILEKQNKDLKTRLANQQSKAEISLCAKDEEIKALRQQHKEDQNTIAMLQKEIADITKELEIAKDVRTEIIQEQISTAAEKKVAEMTAPLLEKLDKASSEIDRLKAQINKTSDNSSKPPSTDGFKKIPNSREKSNRSRGGQRGHTGHRLALPENIDELLAAGLVKKQLVDHTNGSGEYISRYTVDVETITIVTEHRFAPDAKIPKGMYNEVSYGDNIKAMTVMLISEGIIAEQRMSDLLSSLTHNVVNISPATEESFMQNFANLLVSRGELNAIRQDLLNGDVMCTDDTPMSTSQTIEYLENGDYVLREAKNTSFTATVRTHSNDRSTLYTVNPRKDNEGIIRDDILPHFFGILSHDDEAKFYNYGTKHATCGAHLSRDLKGLQDLYCIPWAGSMRSHMSKMNAYKNKDLKNNVKSCNSEQLKLFERQYDELVQKGRDELAQMKNDDWRYNELRKMLNRVTELKDCYLLFIRDYRAPFTSNLAERDLRYEKTKKKVSGPFRSWSGIVRHVKIRSFISTIKKRKFDLFAAISSVIQGISVLQ